MLVTPNLDEVTLITGIDVVDQATQRDAAPHAMGPGVVAGEGRPPASRSICIHQFSSPERVTRARHDGAGDTLAAATASALAHCRLMPEAEPSPRRGSPNVCAVPTRWAPAIWPRCRRCSGWPMAFDAVQVWHCSADPRSPRVADVGQAVRRVGEPRGWLAVRYGAGRRGGLFSATADQGRRRCSGGHSYRCQVHGGDGLGGSILRCSPIRCIGQAELSTCPGSRMVSPTPIFRPSYECGSAAALACAPTEVVEVTGAAAVTVPALAR